MTIDGYGYAWVTDARNDRVQIFNEDGEYVTQFGEEGSGDGQFNTDWWLRIAVADNGNVWLTDSGNSRVSRWQVSDMTPSYGSTFGTEGSGQGQFKYSADVAIDPTDGSLWVADSGNNRIQHFSAAGEYLGQFGSEHPGAVAVDSQGDIYVARALTVGAVRKHNANGEFLQQIAGYGTGPGQVKMPVGLAVDAEDNLWVAEHENDRLQKFDPEGESIQTIPLGGPGRPWGVDVAANGDIWVAELHRNRVSVFDPEGDLLFRFGKKGSGIGEFDYPADVTIDGYGYAWVTDARNDRVQIFNEDGEYVTQFGEEGSGDGQFNTDWWLRIAVADNGNVWLTDSGNSRVSRWKSQGPTTAGYIEPLGVSATDASFGVTSLRARLIDISGGSEIVGEVDQECPAGACSMSAEFSEIDLSEKPTSVYTIEVEAEDGAGNASSASRTFRLDPQPPEIALSGLVAETAGEPLGAPSGDLEITATDENVAVAGVREITVERDNQPVARYPADCSGECQELGATYRYSALRDGAKRSMQTFAEPEGATFTSLSGVACLSADDCHAVGHYRDVSGAISTLAERWDGEAWSIEASPEPEGALESRLEGVDCSTTSDCTAVGHYKTGNEEFSTLAMQWDGSEWEIVPTPSAGEAARAYLYDVTCQSAMDCWAVGKSAHKAGEGENPAAILQRWDGSEWTLIGAAEAPTQLRRISCGSTSSCVAVSGLKPLTVARWDGSGWAQEAVAALPDGGSNGRLHDVSCTEGHECVAVGSYTIGGRQAPLIQRWDGTQWSVEDSVDPFGVLPGAAGGRLDAIACPAADACTAIGATGAQDAMPLIQGWDGVDWALQPGPELHEASSFAPEGISCHDPFACTFVGAYTRSDETRAFIEGEAPSDDGQIVTVEAVDRYGNAESESIAVDVNKKSADTPDCSEETTVVAAKEVVSPGEATSELEETMPTAVAASEALTDEDTEEVIDPSYSQPDPNLENTGSRSEGETSVDPDGGFKLEGIACITPAETTPAATEATVVNGDAALFANSGPATDTVVRPTAGGTTVVHSLRGEESPDTFSWNITVADEAEVVELPSGAIAITEPSEDEGEAGESTESENLESPIALNDAQAQLENGYHHLTSAQAETDDDVLAVIARPWIVLDQGGVVPAQIELKVTEVPTEYIVTFTLPPFELNYVPEALAFEATTSSVANGYCLRVISPCGTFNADRAAKYARFWGNPNHLNARNPRYVDFGSDDCTNFISQILRAGEMKFMRAFERGDGSWWYKNTNPWLPFVDNYQATHSWTLADVLPRHLWRFGLAHIDPVQQPWGWTKGNIVATDWFGTNGKGDINHLFFVVGNHHYAGKGRQPHLANHSTLSYPNKPWFAVKARIEDVHASSWTRFSLAVKHTSAHLNAKKRSPENLYGPGGLFRD